MADEKPNQDRAVRSVAIDMAIRANCGQCYDDQGHMIFDAGEIIKAAGMFEVFIKNGSTPEVTPIATKKEDW